jgi:hypothetical protein
MTDNTPRRSPGRPRVYSDHVRKHAIDLVKKYGVNETWRILRASNSDERAKLRDTEIVPEPLDISDTRIRTWAEKAGVITPKRREAAPDPANLAVRYKEQLKKKNYIVKGEPDKKYFCNFMEGKMQKYVSGCRGEFNLVIAASTGAKEHDFHVLPYPEVKHLFTEHTLKTGPRPRWLITITNGALKIGSKGAQMVMDVSKYHAETNLDECLSRLGPPLSNSSLGGITGE